MEKKKGEKATLKLLAAVMALVICLALCLTGCGGSSADENKESDPMEGNYIPVIGEMMGTAMTGDDLSGFGIELKGNGKGVMTVNGESEKVKWKKDDTTITITVEGKDITGELGEDCFVVKDMLGMGMDFTFAKEGTPASDPALYLPESEKFMIQDWKSVSVTDILGDPTDEIAADVLQMSFRADHTMDLVIEGKEFKNLHWSNLNDYGSVDSEDVKLSWDVEDDGLKATYIKDGEYYIFFCPKDAAADKIDSEKKSEAKSESETESSEESTEKTDESKKAASGAAATAVRSDAQAELGEHGKAKSSPYADYWDKDWYGWYKLESCHGDYEELEDSIYDVCGSIFVESENTGRIVLWDDECSAEKLICEVEVSFGPGTTDAGCMKSEKGSFLTDEENVQHADWMVDPGASDVSDYDHMIEVNCKYEDDHGSFRYYIYLRPWGMDWEDVRTKDVDFLPVSYDYWYTDVMNGLMPDSIGREEGGFGREESERFEKYTVQNKPEHYAAGTLTRKECYLLPNESVNNGATGYILDEDTVIEKPEELDGWEPGDNALSWMARLCDESSGYTPAGVYDITVSGDHIDIIHGLYWWD